MMKHLSWIPWVMAGLTLSILACIGMIVYTLVAHRPQAVYFSGAVWVKEVLRHAAQI